MRALVLRAHAAGMNAGESIVPMPMVVTERANPLDDRSPVVRQYAPIMDGVCGFAWVSLRPANSAFANFLKKEATALIGVTARTDSYAGGVRLPVFAFNQSLTRKEAYAGAFAKVLGDAGFRAYADSRMD